MVLLAICLGVGGAVRAEEPGGAVEAAAAAAEGALVERIEGLVQKLGAEEPRVRALAVEDLQAIGRGAATRLRAALGSEDPEVAARAAFLLERIRFAADGKAAREIAGRYKSRKARVESHWNPQVGVNEVHSLGDDCKVEMRRDAHWITIVLKCRTAEGELKEEYRARSEEELRENHPIVWTIHEAIATSLKWDAERTWWRQWEKKGKDAGGGEKRASVEGER